MEIITLTYKKPVKQTKVCDPRIWENPCGDSFKRIQIPLIRRIYPQLLVSNMVTVTNMDGD